jgi:hypothetical protein
MEEFSTPGSLNGTHREQPRTVEEEDGRSLFFLEALEGFCQPKHPGESPDLIPLYQPHVLRKLQEIRLIQPHLYLGKFQTWIIHMRWPWDKIDRYIQDYIHPDDMPVVLPHDPAPLMPPLPMSIQYDPSLAHGAGAWLDDYITYSSQWSTRGARGFHEAIGLWVLSTVAARRLSVTMGSPRYSMLFFILLADSTLYAKTETIKLGLQALDRAGCAHFLLSEHNTPQALIREMSGLVPRDYGSMDDYEQSAVRKQLASAGQRGWFYEEMGGMLNAIARRDGPMAAYHQLFRQLYDGYKSYTSNTVGRGMERIDEPYLAILGNATPADLQQYMRPGSSYWRDGFWPRFAVIVPEADEQPVMESNPFGTATLPRHLQIQLHNWHTYLGVAESTVTPLVDAKGRPTGEWRSVAPPVPAQELTCMPEVQEAFKAYDLALRQIILDGQVDRDLNACYGRFADKALRVAMLLASLDASETYQRALESHTQAVRDDTVYMKHWVRGQMIVEHWRRMLHQSIHLVSHAAPLSRQEILEQKLEAIIGRSGPQSANEAKRHMRGYSTDEINKTLAAMAQGGRLQAIKTSAKTTRYGFAADAAAAEDALGEAGDVAQHGVHTDVPF